LSPGGTRGDSGATPAGGNQILTGGISAAYRRPFKREEPRMRGHILVLAALFALTGRAQAQVVQTKKALTLEGAKAAAAAATAEAKKGHDGASVAVVDDGGNLMYLERMAPTFPMGATIATEKART